MHSIEEELIYNDRLFMNEKMTFYLYIFLKKLLINSVFFYARYYFLKLKYLVLYLILYI